MLLRSDDGARSHDAHPADDLLGRKAEMLHDIAANHRARPAQPCLAMHGNGSASFLTLGQELGQDVVRRVGPIHEVQFHMLDTLAAELAAVVRTLVQTHHEGHIFLLEIRHVVLRSQGVIAARAGVLFGVRACKGQEPSFHVPVQITVLHLLIVFVLLDIELVEIEKLTLSRLVKTFQSVQDSQVKGTRDWCSVVL